MPLTQNNFSITHRRKSAPKISGALLRRLKEKVLGKEYDLSLVFIGSAYSKTLNKKYRGKDNPANILSFPLEKNVGEIFISSVVKEKDLPEMFIHGLCHLKGMHHGSRMEKQEKQYLKWLVTSQQE